ncbi:MAG: hypothetical protein NXI01_10065 [Gammaproteobacteria bacterium]|nr:hypothetical protein [Gammaproteobacteria bacterium]
MMTFEQALQILGLSGEKINESDAKKARNKILLQTHPDKTKSSETQVEKTRQTLEAYTFLESIEFDQKNVKAEVPTDFSDDASQHDVPHARHMDANENPWHRAFKVDDNTAIQTLLETHDVNALDETQQPPLFWAVLYKRFDLVDLFLQKGANLFTSALFVLAIGAEHVGLIEAIAASNVSDNSFSCVQPCQLLDAYDKKDALRFAIIKGNTALMGILFDRFQMSIDEDLLLMATPASTAITTGSKPEVVRFLVERGARLKAFQQKNLIEMGYEIPEMLAHDRFQIKNDVGGVRGTHESPRETAYNALAAYRRHLNRDIRGIVGTVSFWKKAYTYDSQQEKLKAINTAIDKLLQTEEMSDYCTISEIVNELKEANVHVHSSLWDRRAVLTDDEIQEKAYRTSGYKLIATLEALSGVAPTLSPPSFCGMRFC